MEKLIGKEVYYAKYQPHNGETSIFKGILEEYDIHYKLLKSPYGVEEVATEEVCTIISDKGAKYSKIKKEHVFESFEDLCNYLKNNI